MDIKALETLEDNIGKYYDKNVMIGLSGGINSMAVLCHLANMDDEDKPKKLYLYYAHFDEHSPDTESFVHDGVEYAKQHFDEVIFEQHDNSILSFFNESKMIPHPSISPCTRLLKIEPIIKFMVAHKIDVDLVGYVRTEQRRIKNQQKRLAEDKKLSKQYPIADFSDDDCFDLVKREIGWFPEIYAIKWDDNRILPFIRNEKCNMSEQQYNILERYAKRGYGYRKTDLAVFKHNNCLPCKNMNVWEMILIKLFFPEYYKKSMELSKNIGKHWGRATQYNGEPSSCTYCAFD